MSRYSAAEREMAAKGFVYLANTIGADPYRKTVKQIDAYGRKDLIFDRPAYETAKAKGA